METKHVLEEDSGTADMTSPTGRAIRILELVAASGSISVGDLISRTQIPRPTMQRLVGNLEGLGYLQKHSVRGQYGVGSRFIQTAQDALVGALANASTHAILVELSRQVGESVSLGTLRGGEVVYIDSVASESPLTFRFQTGQGTALHCSSSGYLFLADMNDLHFENYLDTGPWRAVTRETITEPAQLKKAIALVKDRGYATNSSGLVEGVAGIAVPARGANGRVMAALSVASPMMRQSVEDLEAHLTILNEAALHIAQALLPD